MKESPDNKSTKPKEVLKEIVLMPSAKELQARLDRINSLTPPPEEVAPQVSPRAQLQSQLEKTRGKEAPTHLAVTDAMVNTFSDATLPIQLQADITFGRQVCLPVALDSRRAGGHNDVLFACG